jgi:beta-mannosidase
MKVEQLASKIYYSQALPDLIRKLAVDPTTVFVTTDLVVDNQTVSSNLIYLVPTKLIHLPAADITRTLSKEGEAYTLTLSSKVLARSVYLTFGDSKVEVSDNYFNLLPNTPQTITLHSSASLEDLTKSLHIASLVDAFPRP